MKNAKKTKSLLIKNADHLVTMDKKRRVLRNASLYIKGPEIKEVNSKRKKADKTINASGMIILPGFINTHHHMFQTLFRGIDKLKKQQIIPWVKTMSQLVRNLRYEEINVAALIGMAELLLSGCTTTSDFLYVYPQGRNKLFDATVKAAEKIGIRFHPVRGYMEEKKGSLWSSFVTQNGEEILAESERVIDQYHNPEDFSMCQVALGPCGYYSTSRKLFEKTSELARRKGVRLHTHYAESPFENEDCQKIFGEDKTSFLRSVGCLGENVWLAHAIYVTPEDIRALAKTRTKISYCPICNMAKKQPAPVIQMAEAGIQIGIGVDGSASNDSSNLLVEARIAGRLQGLNKGVREVSYLRATEILEMLTLEGAACLGREKTLGSIEEGKAADLVLINLADKLEAAGSVSNPLEAIFHTALSRVDYTLINGEVIVEKGRLTTVNLERLVQKQNLLARKLIKLAEKKLGSSLNLGWTPLLKT